MKSLICFISLAILVSSCAEKNNTGIVGRINSRKITLINANTTFSVDNNINFGISFKKDNESINLTDGTKDNTSISLTDSLDKIVSFTRKAAKVNEINDRYGEGKMVKIEAESNDKSIFCTISLTAYNQFPDVILVQSTFRNISERKYSTRGYVLNKINLRLPTGETKWWSFQGASYHWGQDFVFQIPDSFNRDNYMGLNAVKVGGGIPLTDIWNKEYGVALASISDKPEYISLPVKAENGVIHLEIKKTVKNQIIMPNESLNTVQTAIIVHRNDFYDPLKTYSGLIKPLLPDFQQPVEYAYKTEWCTWGYRQNFRAEDILGKLDRLKTLGAKSVILDDGWSLNHGDWIPDPKKFPAGDIDFKQLINKIHEKGLKVWLWWVPGYADSTSSLAKLHPDWLIKNNDGSVHRSYGLCPAYAPVQEHYKTLVKKFVDEYKLDGFKLDFGEINCAPPCYNPLHNHIDEYESYYSTPLLFKNICENAKQYNPQMLLEYCSCGIPPNMFHLPWTNLAVTSDPNISQITNRIKLYKALRGDDFPVLEEYCGVLAGPLYQITIGAGGVPGTFSTYLDDYHEKWLNIYNKYQLSKGHYLNLYDIGFDYPEAHVIKKDDKYYYAFYTHPWKQMEARRWYRFGTEFDYNLEGRKEIDYPKESYSGTLDLRGLDQGKKYRIVDYENNRELGIIYGNKPLLDVSFVNYLLLEVTPFI
jgi:alpha-galactosidase